MAGGGKLDTPTAVLRHQCNSLSSHFPYPFHLQLKLQPRLGTCPLSFCFDNSKSLVLQLTLRPVDVKRGLPVFNGTNGISGNPSLRPGCPDFKPLAAEHLRYPCHPPPLSSVCDRRVSVIGGVDVKCPRRFQAACRSVQMSCSSTTDA